MTPGRASCSAVRVMLRGDVSALAVIADSAAAGEAISRPQRHQNAFNDMISRKSPMFREKERICQDIAFVLNDMRLSDCAKFAVIGQAIWVWSEFDGKYQGCKLWSGKALNAPIGEKLIHEHPVPRKHIRQVLSELEGPSPESVHGVMDSLCWGVVVTKDEDKALDAAKLTSKMPGDWDGKDVLARYRAVGIVVYSVIGADGGAPAAWKVSEWRLASAAAGA